MKNKKCNKYLDCLHDHNMYFEFNIIRKLGPLLLEDKPIHLFCFRKDFKFKDKILKLIEKDFKDLEKIKYKVIPCVNDTIKILFYNIVNIEKVLNNKPKVDFLKRQGHNELDDYKHFIDYFTKKLEKNIIPPEIGIFFGYPVKDVIGYIGHPSLECTVTKGWKFYGDPRLSEEKFKNYSTAEKLLEKYIDLFDESTRKIIKSIDKDLS